MDKESMGALWEKTSKKGLVFLTGKITVDGKDIDVVVFKNDKGDNPKRPDWRIYPSEPRTPLNDNGTEKVIDLSGTGEDGIPF